MVKTQHSTSILTKKSIFNTTFQSRTVREVQSINNYKTAICCNNFLLDSKIVVALEVLPQLRLVISETILTYIEDMSS